METLFNLAGRTALITGASSGLGERFALLYAKAGARVVLGARRVDRLDGLAARINSSGGEALAVPLDVTDEKSVVAAFDVAEKSLGGVDTVVANAGIVVGGRSTDIAASDVRGVFDTNSLGVYLIAREGARRMISQGSREKQNGRIIIIGSITAVMTNQGDAAYAASKAAVAHLSRQFAREWVRQGINVNVVQPGYIATELSGDRYSTDEGHTQIAGFHRRRLQDAASLDDMMLYLASDRSGSVTGATFTIDDGQSL